MRVHALILDLDDTLFDSRAAYAAGVAAALALCPEIQGAGAAFAAARAGVKARLPRGHVASHSRWAYFKALLDERQAYSTARHLELMRCYETALAAHLAHQWRRLERDKLLDRLLERAPLAVITNEQLRTQVLKLAAVDPAGRLFKHVLTSEEHGREKPDPTLHLAALARLGVAPEATLVVGNSVADDVEPALRLGCRALWSTEFASPEDGPAGGRDAVPRIARLDEMLRYVA